MLPMQPPTFSHNNSATKATENQSQYRVGFLPTNTKTSQTKKLESEQNWSVHWLLRSLLIHRKTYCMSALSCFHPSIHPPPFLVIKAHDSPLVITSPLLLRKRGPWREAPPKKERKEEKKNQEVIMWPELANPSLIAPRETQGLIGSRSDMWPHREPMRHHETFAEASRK